MSEPSAAPKLDFIREIIAHDLASGKHSAPITRFPPEPNGYLHIGHAKAICLSFGIAEEYAQLGATCHLRFDDTNPEKEESEYVESIKTDVQWLGFDWGKHLYFASDYFEFFYDCALHLIRQGLAYVDEDSAEEIRRKRGNLTTPGIPSDNRERAIEDHLALFARMRAGEFPEGACVLRAKIDLASSNMNMRDPLLYRILHTAHHNTGDSWCIYPMYDFAHPLEDALEHITHSLCTLEFENHRPLYDWFIANCPVPSTPRQIEFARLNLTYTVMSKRKLLQLVQEGHVTGWDDPRLPTISGLRRRGYPAPAIRDFCRRVGITKFNGSTDTALLEHEVRDFLNAHAPRRMAVLDPIMVIIDNWHDDPLEQVELPNHPQDPAFGSRQVPLSAAIWIERDDFLEDPPKKFYRLGPGRHVRLRGGPIIRYRSHRNGDDGRVEEIHVELLPGTTGVDTPDGVECRAAIHWVDAKQGVDAELRLYDRLFTVEDPDAAEGGFTTVLNPQSLVTIRAKVEPSLADADAGFSCQFERLGYFIADALDHCPGTKPVFNRSVPLKDSWSKQSRR